jgi:phospholipase/carboxylesterase
MLLLTLVACDRHAGEHGSGPASTAAARTGSASADAQFGPVRELGGVRFLAFVVGGAAEGDKLPTIVALHGRGDSADNFARDFVGVRAHARIVVPYGFFPTDEHGFEWFSNDRSPDRKPEVFDRGASEALPRLATFLADFPKSLPTLAKPILTGFSQGAILTHVIAAQRPELIGLAVPAAGFLPPGLAPSGKLAEPLPRVVAYHGDVDTVVSYAWDQLSVQQEKRAGLAAEFRLFPGVDHRFGSEEFADYLNLLDDAARTIEKTSVSGH